MSRTINKLSKNRLFRVFEYIEQHLENDLSLTVLADVACSSKYHFHRQFSALAGMPPYQYIQLQRLKRAGYRLSFRQQDKIGDIAFDAGFENAESFSRAFKKVFGQPPLAFRQNPDWDTWQAKFESNNLQELKAMPQHQVKIVEFPATQVAAFEHKGPPGTIMNSVRNFIQWRKRNNLGPQVSATYNIFYHDHTAVPPQDYRMDICAATEQQVTANPEGVINKIIPGGRCALLRHIGSDALLQNSVTWLYGHWLEQSDEQLRDAPLFVHRVNLFPDVAEHEMICDIYLPLI